MLRPQTSPLGSPVLANLDGADCTVDRNPSRRTTRRTSTGVEGHHSFRDQRLRLLGFLESVEC